jgi:hypothetical protein
MLILMYVVWTEYSVTSYCCHLDTRSVQQLVCTRVFFWSLTRCTPLPFLFVTNWHLNSYTVAIHLTQVWNQTEYKYQVIPDWLVAYLYLLHLFVFITIVLILLHLYVPLFFDPLELSNSCLTSRGLSYLCGAV